MEPTRRRGTGYVERSGDVHVSGGADEVSKPLVVRALWSFSCVRRNPDIREISIDLEFVPAHHHKADAGSKMRQCKLPKRVLRP